jgi:hypothetical protein
MSSIRSAADLASATTTANRLAPVARRQPAGKIAIIDGLNGLMHNSRGPAPGTPKER